MTYHVSWFDARTQLAGSLMHPFSDVERSLPMSSWFLAAGARQSFSCAYRPSCGGPGPSLSNRAAVVSPSPSVQPWLARFPLVRCRRGDGPGGLPLTPATPGERSRSHNTSFAGFASSQRRLLRLAVSQRGQLIRFPRFDLGIHQGSVCPR